VASYCRLEPLHRQSVFERLNAVNRDNWNVMLVTLDWIGIAFNVDLMPRCRDDLFSFVTEMTTRTAVDDYLRFSSHGFTGSYNDFHHFRVFVLALSVSFLVLI